MQQNAPVEQKHDQHGSGMATQDVEQAQEAAQHPNPVLELVQERQRGPKRQLEAEEVLEPGWHGGPRAW